MRMSQTSIEDHVSRPDRHNVKQIKVLRVGNELPMNYQVGATCGIYALDAAMQIQGIQWAPRKQFFGDWRKKGIQTFGSIRGIAKDSGLSKIGEISSAADMVKLAEQAVGVATHAVEQAAGLGVNAKAKTFYSEQELWILVANEVNKGHSVIFPYACAGDDGAPAWWSDGFAHWCLLFGYAEYLKGYQRIFMTTYGYYHGVLPVMLFKANQRIQDWPRQTWIKLFYWMKEPGKSKFNESPWKAEWLAKSTAVNTISEHTELFKQYYPGAGLAFGTKDAPLHTLIDPPNLKPNLNFSIDTVKSAKVKSEVIEEVQYTKTFRGQCVVI